MSIQIFLQGKLLGVREFLSSPGHNPDLSRGQEELLFAGRSYWLSLLSEVLPRALLAEFGLSSMLLGSSGGGQFLLVLPLELQAQSEEFLDRAASDIEAIS